MRISMYWGWPVPASLLGSQQEPSVEGVEQESEDEDFRGLMGSSVTGTHLFQRLLMALKGRPLTNDEQIRLLFCRKNCMETCEYCRSRSDDVTD